ncbi:MAG: thiamine phosphate synthase [Bacteroidia bacterium]|nr:thiamine phosphate synthase [Bacteroidia bacterium]MCX7763548.1 thiamine phosphate synthase [Bacteroidia bacterium]MDW8058369.1 thiamine phosphate synthase [Bacteroidia bacterium]
MRDYWEAMAITPWQVEDLDRWTEGAVKKGATAVVLRLSHPPTLEELWKWAERWEGLPWLVHARWASQQLGYGMHFPAPPTSPGPKIAPSYLYGQSCHTPEEVALAAEWASYVWIGSFFPTPSHPERPNLLSLETLKDLRRTYPTLPLVAVGGIDSEEKIGLVKEAGAWGFAGIRYFMSG